MRREEESLACFVSRARWNAHSDSITTFTGPRKLTKHPLPEESRRRGDNVGAPEHDRPEDDKPPIDALPTDAAIVVMGPSGSGKTTIGRRLAEQLRRPFVDADDHHSPENVAKMRSGVGLTDEDREPWLLGLRALLKDSPRTILACSALKKSYRTLLRPENAAVVFLLLDVPEEELARRLEARQGHYAGPSLLKSQLALLEPPAEEIGVFVIDGSGPESVVLSRALRALARAS